MPDVRRHILGLLDGAPKTQEAVAAVLHTEAHPTGAGKQVLTMQGAGRAFEWHPISQKVYYLRDKGNGVVIGEIVAFNIVTHGDAKNAVLIWLRGFTEGQRPNEEKPNLQEGNTHG